MATPSGKSSGRGPNRKPRSTAEKENIIDRRKTREFVRKSVGSVNRQKIALWSRHQWASARYYLDRQKNPYFQIEVTKPNGGRNVLWAVQVSPKKTRIELIRIDQTTQSPEERVITNPLSFSVELSRPNRAPRMRFVTKNTPANFKSAVETAIRLAEIDVLRAFAPAVFERDIVHRPDTTS